ncbi:phosphonopyruvate decarboxylase [Gammaproteobacteria bacterium]|nr:phosphonopyruvate decarboxylase [Gammaproteobacteria bacterium]
MIDVKEFFDSLRNEGVYRYCGVPDSLLKNICAYISDNTTPNEHLITANEGSAVALAVGQYIATGKPSLVYMQNSGFGNAINPLLSLADSKVYAIPMLLMVGWRGEPGIKDEPQHIKQGEIMERLLNACDLPTIIIGADTKNIEEVLKSATAMTITNNQPVVLLVKKGTFGPYKLKNTMPDIANLSREDAIEVIVEASELDDVFVSTTGMPSRELFEIRVKNQQSHEKDFLTVGSMGHANMIALGVAQNTDRHVFCIDGDGASIMHLGNLTSSGQSGSKNLIHIILNNAAHDSVGGQPTCAGEIDLPSIAKACGYTSTKSMAEPDEIRNYIKKIKSQPGPHLLEVKIKKGSRSDLGRPTSSPIENKTALMNAFR